MNFSKYRSVYLSRQTDRIRVHESLNRLKEKILSPGREEARGPSLGFFYSISVSKQLLNDSDQDLRMKSYVVLCLLSLGMFYFPNFFNSLNSFYFVTVYFCSASPLEIILPLFATEDSPGIPIVASITKAKPEDFVESREDVEQEKPIQKVKEERQDKTREERQLSIPTGNDKPKLNIIEILKGMGSAIQLLARQPNSQGETRSDGTSVTPVPAAELTEEARERYREQAEILRGEINRRSGQLQKVVGAAIDALKDKGDVVVRRILENLQTRLGQAKQRADRILKEPENGELAVRTLNSINQGMGNLATLVQHVLARVNISINVDLKEGAAKTLTNAAVAAVAASANTVSSTSSPLEQTSSSTTTSK